MPSRMLADETLSRMRLKARTLRTPLSTVVLGIRTVAQNSQRHKARQTQRDKGLAIEVVGSPSRPSIKKVVNQPTCISPYQPLHPLSANRISLGNDSNHNRALISEAPVPQASKSYWDIVLADASTPSELWIQRADKHPQIVQRSNVSRELTEGFKASIEDENCGHNSLTETYNNALLGIPSSSELRGETIDQHQSNLSTRLFRLQPNPEDLEDSLHRELFEAIVRRPASPLDVDGSSDIRITQGAGLGEHSTACVGLDFDGNHPTLCPGDAIPTNNPRTRLYVEPVPGESQIFHSSLEGRKWSDKPLYRLTEQMRHRSIGLPRSPLYIAEAAASSSPEKDYRPSPSSTSLSGAQDSHMKQPCPVTEPTSDNNAAVSGLLHQPPRRLKRYRSRSRSHSPEIREIQRPAETPYLSASFARRFPARLPMDSAQPSSIPKIVPPRTPGTSSLDLSLHPSHRFTHRLLDPRTPAFTPSPRRFSHNSTFPTPSLPLHPFSTIPRTVSFNIPTSSSPSSSTSSSPSYVNSPTTPPPPHRVPVYNDRLPAALQPQTPARLPRNGIPVMSSMAPHRTGIGLAVGAMTAPEAGRARARPALGVEAWQRLARGAGAETPTRSSRRRGIGPMVGNVEQENVGLDVEMARYRERVRGPWREEQIDGGRDRRALTRTPD